MKVLWCTSAHRQSQLPSDPLAVGSDLVSPVRSVRDLGIFIDADVTMRTQVTQTCSKCFAALRQLRSIRRSVSNDVMQSLIVALVFSRLDYCSAILAGLPKQLLDRLQSVQNAAARLIFKACRQDHIQPLLRRLHWLRTPERVSFRLVVLVYRCLHGSAPGYLASDLGLRSSARVTPKRTSTTALFDYISAGRFTHCAFYHWRPRLSSDCCIGLEQFAVVASFSQQTENRTFCPVLQT